ncbi:MAG: Ig-like domain repeat protein [Myxococcales bacterium]|nr:Ig-like domain repeat protein [Myxococcales bacterium]
MRHRLWGFCFFLCVWFFSACRCGEVLPPQEGQVEQTTKEDAGLQEKEPTQEQSLPEESTVEITSEKQEQPKEISPEPTKESSPEDPIDGGPSKAQLSFRVLSKTEDIVPPRLKQIKISPNPVKAGEIIVVEMETENDLSGVIAAQITLASPNAKHSLYLSTSFNPSLQRFVGRIRIPAYVESGTWIATRATLQDQAGNPTVYQAMQAPLSGTTLVVQAGQEDVDAPTLQGLTLLAQQAKAGEELGLWLQVSHDPSGIKQIQISASGDQGGYLSATAFYHPQRKRYEAYLSIPKTGPDGKWSITQVQLEDLAENRFFVSAQDPLLMQKDFTVSGSTAPPPPSTDQEAPEIQGLHLSKNEFNVGELLSIAVKIEDKDSGVARGRVSITDPAGAERLFIDLSYNTSRELWEGQVQIPAFSRDGLWKIKQISATDRAGNSSSVEGTALEQLLQLPEASNTPKNRAYGTQGTADPNADRLAPEILGIRIAPGEIQATEDARLYLALRDPGGSGIASGSCTAQGPLPGEQKRIPLQYNSDTGFYEGNFNFQKEDSLGDWWISGCYITDRAGQASSIPGWQLRSLTPLDISRATPRAGQDPFSIVRKGTPPSPPTDQQAPTLKSYQISASSISVGGYLRMYALVEDVQDPITSLNCTFQAQKTPTSYATTQLEISLAYRRATGRVEGEAQIPLQAIDGAWWLQRCVASDRAGNQKAYEGDALGSIPLLAVPELVSPPQEHRGFQVQIVAGPTDQIPPTIEAAAIAPAQQVAGQPGRVFLKAQDNDEIRYAFCSIKPPAQDVPNAPYLSAQLSWNPQHMLWEGNFQIPKDAVAGDWSLSRCQVSDRSGNNVQISDEAWSKRKPLDLSGLFPVTLKKQVSIEIQQGSAPSPKDTTPPTLKALRWLPSSQAKAGDIILLEVQAEDTESGVSQVSALLQSPTQKATMWLSFQRNHATGHWESEVELPLYKEDGNWFIAQLGLYDLAGNQKTLSSSDPLLQAALLAVSGTATPTDQAPPTLVSLQRSQATLLTGESVRFIAEINDASPLRQAFLQVQSPSGQQQQVRLEWNPATLRYEGDVAFALYAEAGIWKISTFVATDTFDNNLRLDQTDPRLQALSLTLRRPPQANDLIPPTLGKIMIAATQTKQGQSFRVLAEVTDQGTGVKDAQVTFLHTSGQQLWGQLSYNPASGLYEATVNLSETSSVGVWKISKVEISDIAGNTKTYTETDPELQP